MDDDNEENRMEAMLAGMGRAQYAAYGSDRGPVPRPGSNREFDRHVRDTFGDVDPDTADIDELRRAAWLTWGVAAPPPRSAVETHHEEDDELAQALALSAREHAALHGASHSSPIVIDDDDDDNDLQRAIALSEAEQRNPPPAPAREETPEEERKMLAEALKASMDEVSLPPVAEEEVDSDEEIAAANLALQMSREAYREEQRQERDRKRQKIASTAETSPACVSAPPSAPVSGASTPVEPIAKPATLTAGLQLGALKIDRAALERERLARQAARSAPSTAAMSATKSSTASSSSALMTTLSASQRRRCDHPLQSTGTFHRDAAGEYYLEGELRHVALKIGDPTTEPTFGIHDVFGDTSQMSLLIVSSFVWDNPWIDRDAFFPMPDVCPTIRICRPPVEDFNKMRSLQGKFNIRPDGEAWCYPDMAGKRGAEHMKFAWIFYKTGRLRVAIMTANLVDYDYEQIENTVFVQDFLPLKGSRVLSSRDSTILPEFPDQFRLIFTRLRVHEALGKLEQFHPLGKSLPLTGNDKAFADLARFDWSRVTVRLVASMPGTYTGFDKMKQYGIARLATVLEEEGWVPKKNERLVGEFQSSSLGRYGVDWYNNFYEACCGKSLLAISRIPKPKTWPPLKIIFPSLATVDNSINGRPGGGTMFSSSSFTDKTKHMFHDANSKRGGVLMHAKVLIALFEPAPSPLGASASSSGKRKADELDEGEGVGGWAYVGSHNFSPSAWGTLNFDNKPPTLNINNYELGLVFPLARGQARKMADSVAPHKRPARPYGPTDEPWSQNKHMPQ